VNDPRLEKYQLEGIASWYGGKFQGRLTANGEVFDTNHLTAAHRELPFGTIVRVINTTNNRVVVVRINDRGPFVDDRVIDLSRAAADIIGLTAAGIAPVRLEIVHYQEASTIRTIQVASFGDRANADALVTRLRGEELPASIETVQTAGVHRVVIPGIEETAIPEVQQTLASLGYRNVLVRQE
jgi:rare lipoprotein A